MKIAAWILAALILGAAGFAGYLGVFNQVTIAEESLGPYQFVYRPIATVDFREVATITDDMDTMLAAISVDERAPMEVYFPDGSAQIGFKIAGVELDMALSDGTRVRTISHQRFAVSRFPWRSPLSFVVGHLKVDPALDHYARDRGYPAVEAMTMLEGSLISYLRPVRSD